MRRKDREITDRNDILSVLDGCEVMRVGFCADRQPYIVPLHFARTEAGNIFYFHCATEGRKLDMLAQNDRVCFETDRLIAIEMVENACQCSSQYESVMGEGFMTVVADETERVQALDLLMRRYGYEGELSYSREALKMVTVLKLTVSDITGKRR